MIRVLWASMYYSATRPTGANLRFMNLGVSLAQSVELTVVVRENELVDWHPDVREIYFEDTVLGRVRAGIALHRLLNAEGYDFLISDLVPTVPSRKTYFLIHDLRQFTPYSRHAGLVSDFLIRQHIACQKNVMTVSHFSASEIKKLGCKNVLVVPNGISPHDAVTPNPNLKREFDVLYVATFETRKNHLALVRALAVVKDSLLPRRLSTCFVGFDLGTKGEVRDEARRLGLSGNILFKENIDQDELVRLYLSTTVFVSPSLYEGFGMPILEALAYNVPVVCSDIPVFREVGGAFCKYADPANISEFAQEILDQLGKGSSKPDSSEYVRKTYSWDLIASDLGAILRAEGTSAQ